MHALTIIKTKLINELKHLKKENLIEEQVQLKLEKENNQKIQIDKLTLKNLNSCNIIISYEKIYLLSWYYSKI